MTRPRCFRSWSVKLWHAFGIAVLVCNLLIQVSNHAAATDRRYQIYQSDKWGLPKNPLTPDAVIEVDEFTGRGLLFKADKFGNLDILEGPTHIIEADVLPSANTLDSEKPCSDLSRGRRRRYSRCFDECDDEDRQDED